MLKQNLQPDYTQFCRTKQLILPLETDHFIAPNESVRLFDHVMDELDYSELYRTYARKGRKPGTDPATMTKIVVYTKWYNRFLFTFQTQKGDKSMYVAFPFQKNVNEI
jgi:hypothetical protein